MLCLLSSAQGLGRELTCMLEGVEKGPADRQADRHTHRKKGRLRPDPAILSVNQPP